VNPGRAGDVCVVGVVERKRGERIMRLRTTMLVVPVLVLELAACGRPVVIVRAGHARPVPAHTVEACGPPGLDVLGETPVTGHVRL
jgi:hypothetical protein